MNTPRISKENLIDYLKRMNGVNVDADHRKADELLLEYINDPEITEAFEEMEKYYS